MLAPGGPEVSKFEQVSSDGHQMSLAGGSGNPVQWGPTLKGDTVQWGPMHHG